MNVTQISDIIYRDFDDPPSSVSIPKIAFWVRYDGIGRLNDLLDLEISIDETTLELDTELSLTEISILKTLYMIRFYEKMMESSLGAGAYTTLDQEWNTIQEGDTRISRISRVDKAREFKALQEKQSMFLDEAVAKYRINKAIPKEERCCS